MVGRKYYHHYEEIYASALAAGVDIFNNPPPADTSALFNNPLIPLSGKVLDLGCGEGIYSLEFASRGYRVVGIDISSSAVKWAQDRAAAGGISNTHFMVGDVTRLDELPDNHFDLVLNIHCYHCLSMPEDRQAHLREAWRVLNPGGIFLFDNMAAPRPEDMPQFRNWHTSRKGMLKENKTGVSTTVKNTPAYSIKRRAGSDLIEFEIENAVALAHRFYSHLDQVLEQLKALGFEILSAEFRPPDPTQIPEMKFIQGDNIIFARKPVLMQQEPDPPGDETPVAGL